MWWDSQPQRIVQSYSDSAARTDETTEVLVLWFLAYKALCKLAGVKLSPQATGWPLKQIGAEVLI